MQSERAPLGTHKGFKGGVKVVISTTFVAAEPASLVLTADTGLKPSDTRITWLSGRYCCSTIRAKASEIGSGETELTQARQADSLGL
jgi:hypothetical protein